MVFDVSNTTERPSLGKTATVFLLANPAQGDDLRRMPSKALGQDTYVEQLHLRRQAVGKQNLPEYLKLLKLYRLLGSELKVMEDVLLPFLFTKNLLLFLTNNQIKSSDTIAILLMKRRMSNLTRTLKTRATCAPLNIINTVSLSKLGNSGKPSSPRNKTKDTSNLIALPLPTLILVSPVP